MALPRFPVEGGCQCGAVRYRLKASPRTVYNCHCKDCISVGASEPHMVTFGYREFATVVAPDPRSALASSCHRDRRHLPANYLISLVSSVGSLWLGSIWEAGGAICLAVVSSSSRPPGYTMMRRKTISVRPPSDSASAASWCDAPVVPGSGARKCRGAGTFC